ncbi:MAG: transglutaminase domain-containing protein [Phycisphaerales bacterium]
MPNPSKRSASARASVAATALTFGLAFGLAAGVADGAEPVAEPAAAAFSVGLAGVSSAEAAGTAVLHRATEEAIKRAAKLAGDNADQIRLAIASAPDDQRPAMRALVAGMPASDLQTLSADFLLAHVDGAFAARRDMPWGASIPDEIFFRDVVPYACVSERRDPWDADLAARARRIIGDASTPGEAALRLNATLFGELGVRYSTTRKRPDQASRETIEQGVATCTGLSILLVDACRAVAVPARLAGCASWHDDRGNHTWVEVWDGDAWRFVGAAEPDQRGFDHGWFTGDAARATPGHPRYAIQATSWGPAPASADQAWPMVWDASNHNVPAIDVTRRYQRGDVVADASTVRLMVRVVDAGGTRVAVPVSVAPHGGTAEPDDVRRGTSRPSTADMHDHVSFDLAPGGRWAVVAGAGGPQNNVAVVDLSTAEPGESRVVTVELAARKAGAELNASAAWTALSPEAINAIGTWADAMFAGPADQALPAVPVPAVAEAALRNQPEAVRSLLWQRFRAAPRHESLREEMAANRADAGNKTSPYVVRTVGERPAGGWPLVIAMHGGGGTTTEFNDSQWRHMQIYYRDQPQAGGYKYLALRAPTDEWNGFYTDYMYPVMARLIEQFLVHGDVDPNRVYAIGYSHGGYGAYAIGPVMPDRFGAVHASAAAATDGVTRIENLMATRFTAMIGELDTAYGRVVRNRAFAARAAELAAEVAGEGDGLYPIEVREIEGNGHGGLPDRDILPELLTWQRTPMPARIRWHPSTSVITRFFWLADDAAGRGRTIDASCADNRVMLDVAGPETMTVGLRLDHRLVDVTQPLAVDAFGKSFTVDLQPSLRTLAATMAERGDPALATSLALTVGPTGVAVAEVDGVRRP